MLPIRDKFLTAKLHLSYAGERGLLASYAPSEDAARNFKTDCISELKKAAEALGYELVERLPGIPTEAAAHVINACETVPNGARDA